MSTVCLYWWKDSRLHRTLIGHVCELLLECRKAHDKWYHIKHGWKDRTRPAHVIPSYDAKH